MLRESAVKKMLPKTTHAPSLVATKSVWVSTWPNVGENVILSNLPVGKCLQTWQPSTAKLRAPRKSFCSAIFAVESGRKRYASDIDPVFIISKNRWCDSSNYLNRGDDIRGRRIIWGSSNDIADGSNKAVGSSRMLHKRAVTFSRRSTPS